MEWINSIPNQIVYPRRTILNRADNRSYLKSARKINKDVSEIEAMFIADLFQANRGFSYDDIYKFHLNQFRICVEWHIKYGKHENVVINESYFLEKFKPL